MVVVGIFVDIGPRRFTGILRRPGRSVGLSLRLLVGLCILYGVVWTLHA